MNHSNIRLALATLALAAVPAIASDSDAPVAVNTDGLTRLVAKKVEENAAMGMQQLRRHLWSTFHLHRVLIEDVLKDKDDVIAANDAPAVKKEFKLATRTR
ncbi:hypothetical protein [Usitatibacter palustris]|uniref:RxLR effector protein n=1 Tax=Usitatibacter palustris TaxID=2732487 RepID=A0A6M4H5Z8_9PROT|nr:hypothetical protein [Usitatibacter palustris]QJR13327.1 hypothetical protein DSM104440_00110 [Usitatibacter palustris]